VQQKTNYPWEGTVTLHVSPATPETFTVSVRIPGWSRVSTVMVNGKAVSGVTPGKYLALSRLWSGRDTVELSFDMRPQLMRANPAVTEDTGRVAMQRGPLVYCMEELDQPGSGECTNFYLYQASLSGESTFRYDASLLNGVVEVEHAGAYGAGRGGGTPDPASLYETVGNASPETKAAPEHTQLKLIPYYAWANREDSAMQVWIPSTQV
ncbi:MAG TPA: hypothetical protein VK638_46360, partial [Edaphobacter sp.]|nr:hypothetical protein [Edaphobacter sp.]